MLDVRGVALVVIAGFAGTAHAATFNVTNTATSGAGSLHQAILSANATEAADTINFAIPGGGVKTIAGDLPPISQPVTINGYTQPTSLVNTAPVGVSNATIRIELDGSALAVGAPVLEVTAGPTTIRGLAIKGMKAKTPGISVSAEAAQVSVLGCFLGTDAAGAVDASSGIGILVDGTASIGSAGPADRNVISGNDGAGILLRGSDSTVENNLIGPEAFGESFLPNGDGIQISGANAHDNSIGTAAPGSGNRIIGNEGNGITLVGTAGDGNVITGNAIEDNGELGIDLGNNGVTRNDADDSDTGPNGLLNFPEVAFARINGSTLRAEGVVVGPPGTYRVEIFANQIADDSGFGEGQTFLGSMSTKILSGKSAAAFGGNLDLGFEPDAPLLVTATARNEAGDTSEFSRATKAWLGGTEIVVTNTNASGPGSLEDAIAQANVDVLPNTIVFAIPQEAPLVITPGTELGINEAPIIIDGYTQEETSFNTLETGTNARIDIVLDGTGTNTAALGVFRTSAVIRGIVVNNGGGDGIRFVDAEESVLEGSFIGTDFTGTADAGNEDHGVNLNGTGIVVGGPSRANRNLISGNGFQGINDVNDGSSILNNLIGSDAEGTGDIPNRGGISASGIGTKIGSDEAGLGNLIRGNTEAGIEVSLAASQVEILGNDVAGNGELGIDLLEEGFNSGVTDNDADDADEDGANALQNFPVLASAAPAGGTVTIEGSLDVPAAKEETVYRLRFFRSAACDESGHGEGEVFLGAANVLIPASEEFTVKINGVVSDGDFLTATATDPDTGTTSEFSECFEVGAEEAPLCGDVNGNEDLAAGDALLVLQAAVGTGTCELCICDTNGNGTIQSSDALLTLRAAVGQPVTLECPECE